MPVAAAARTVSVPGDQVLVDVLVMTAGTEQVTDQFDIETGLPGSMATLEPEPEPEKPRTFLMLAQEFVTRQWPHAAPKTRDGLTDALATVMPALTRAMPGTPNPGALRTALRSYIQLPEHKRPEPTAQVTQALQWLESASLPIADLGWARVILSALDALALRLDGKTAGATTINGKRAVFHSVLEYAVQIGDLDSNPLHKVKWTPPKTSETVDPASWSTQTRPPACWSR
jgi:hypothetical protein